MPVPPAKLDPKLQAMVETARADLLGRLAGESVDAADITLLRAERVMWRSGALGCPMPDRAYTMVLTPGVLIVLRAGQDLYEYHGNPAGTPFLCEAPGVIETPAPAGSSTDPT